MLEFKIKLISRIKKEIEEKIQDAEKSYSLAKESRDADTKSSAGDKYETGREMMQKEMDKSLSLIHQYQQQYILINTIENKFENTGKQTTMGIEIGDLVESSQGTFFIAFGLGKLTFDNKVIFVISLDSPIGLQLKGKKIGETYQLNGNTYKIISIL